MKLTAQHLRQLIREQLLTENADLAALRDIMHQQDIGPDDMQTLRGLIDQNRNNPVFMDYLRDSKHPSTDILFLKFKDAVLGLQNHLRALESDGNVASYIASQKWGNMQPANRAAAEKAQEDIERALTNPSSNIGQFRRMLIGMNLSWSYGVHTMAARADTWPRDEDTYQRGRRGSWVGSSTVSRAHAMAAFERVENEPWWDFDTEQNWPDRRINDVIFYGGQGEYRAWFEFRIVLAPSGLQGIDFIQVKLDDFSENIEDIMGVTNKT